MLDQAGVDRTVAFGASHLFALGFNEEEETCPETEMAMAQRVRPPEPLRSNRRLQVDMAGSRAPSSLRRQAQATGRHRPVADHFFQPISICLISDRGM